jgi:hypothetical protein
MKKKIAAPYTDSYSFLSYPTHCKKLRDIARPGMTNVQFKIK